MYAINNEMGKHIFSSAPCLYTKSYLILFVLGVALQE